MVNLQKLLQPIANFLVVAAFRDPIAHELERVQLCAHYFELGREPVVGEDTRCSVVSQTLSEVEEVDPSESEVGVLGIDLREGHREDALRERRDAGETLVEGGGLWPLEAKALLAVLELQRDDGEKGNVREDHKLVFRLVIWKHEGFPEGSHLKDMMQEVSNS